MTGRGDEALARRLRHRIYTALAGQGRAPTVTTLASAEQAPLERVRDALAALHDEHAIVLDASGEVRMALPFANVATAYQVESERGRWHANCAWDALAIPRLLGLRTARVIDAGGPAREGRALEIRDGELVDQDGVVAFPLPAHRWWQDIAFT